MMNATIRTAAVTAIPACARSFFERTTQIANAAVHTVCTL